MKKILLFCSIFSILLSSCSSDDSTPDAPTVPLVKKIEKTFERNTKTYTSEFSYDGRKITKQIEKEDNKYVQTTTYQYTGDVISGYEISNGSGFISSKSFTYEGNRLKSWLEKTKATGIDKFYYVKGTYTYNANGTVSIAQNLLDMDTKEETNPVIGLLTFTNGNVSKEVYDVFNLGITTNVDFEYDSKNSPYKNVLGVHSLLNIGGFGYSENNTAKLTVADDSVPTGARVYSTTFTYDQNNFPTESKRSGDNDVLITKFFY